VEDATKSVEWTAQFLDASADGQGVSSKDRRPAKRPRTPSSAIAGLVTDRSEDDQAMKHLDELIKRDDMGDADAAREKLERYRQG
jgi:hypothetical protein